MEKEIEDKNFHIKLMKNPEAPTDESTPIEDFIIEFQDGPFSGKRLPFYLDELD